MIQEEKLHEEIVSFLNEIPELPIETSFNIIEENGNLFFSEIIQGTESEVGVLKFTPETIGSCHFHPIAKNKEEGRLNSTPSPGDIVTSLSIGRGFHYSLNCENKSIYVIKPLKKISEKEAKKIYNLFLEKGKQIISLPPEKRIKLMESLAGFVRIKKLQ